MVKKESNSMPEIEKPIFEIFQFCSIDHQVLLIALCFVWLAFKSFVNNPKFFHIVIKASPLAFWRMEAAHGSLSKKFSNVHLMCSSLSDSKKATLFDCLKILLDKSLKDDFESSTGDHCEMFNEWMRCISVFMQL